MGSEKAIRVGVVGVGNMGRNHLRLYASMPHYELVGLYDANAELATTQAAQYGVTAFTEYDALLDAVDALSIVVPSFLHRDYAVQAATEGRHVLVEKPIALTLEDADAIIAACAAAGVTLCVGHVERYNPAIVALADVIEHSELVALDFQRLSPFDGRITDTDVVCDLMVHDLEVLGWLVPEPVKRVQSQGVCVHSDKLDYAQALIEYESGVVASLTASRATETKVRTARLTGRTSCVMVDYLNRQIEVLRKTHFSLDVGHDLRYRQESIVEQVAVPFKEPLLAELEEFARAIREQDTPRTSGPDARRALELCGLIVAGAQ